MSIRTPVMILAFASLTLLAACGESEDSGAAALTDAAQSATKTAQDTASEAQQSSAPEEDQAAGQEAISDYIAGMEDLTNIARSVTDKLSAVSQTPKAKAALDKVKEAWAALDKLNPELKAQLTNLSQSKLDSLTSTLKSEAQRIASELGLPDLAAILNDAPLLTGG